MGLPDYYTTFTTNPNWPEIQEILLPGEKLRDHPDLCARVFKLKHDHLMNDMLNKQILGKVRAYSSTIEWLKRGLIHSQNFYIMEDESKS